LELTGRHTGACRALQPPAARFGVDSPGGRRSVLGTLTGGRQLNAVSVRQHKKTLFSPDLASLEPPLAGRGG
jgi:hypothetical protein